MGNELRRVVGRRTNRSKRKSKSRGGSGSARSNRRLVVESTIRNDEDGQFLDANDDFNWYYVKQQKEMARAIGNSEFSASLLLDIQRKIVAQLEKLDGFESARKSYVASGADKLNPHVLAVLCATCFSQCEQQELIELLLNTNELVNCDDVYCAMFEASSYALVTRLLDAYVSTSTAAPTASIKSLDSSVSLLF